MNLSDNLAKSTMMADFISATGHDESKSIGGSANTPDTGFARLTKSAEDSREVHVAGASSKSQTQKWPHSTDLNKAGSKSNAEMDDDDKWIHSVDSVSFPHENQNKLKREKRWFHDVADFANLLKSFIGTNYLSLAYGIMLSGLGLGLIGLVLVAALTAHCCRLIVKVKYHAIKRIIDKSYRPITDSTTSSLPSFESNEDREKFRKLQQTVTYVDVGRMAYGRWGARFVQFFLVITQIGFCVNYHIFIGSNIYSLITPQNTSSSDPPSSNNGFKINSVYGVFDFFQGSASNTSMPNETSTLSSIVTEPSTVNYTTGPPVESPGSWIPPLALLVAMPLPIFIGFTLFRNVRLMGVVSLIANGMMSAAYFVVVAYIISTFSLADDLKWFEWSTFPVFLGQAAASYEAIGTLLSIEASMDGNHYRYSSCLYSVVSVFSTMLTLSAVLGYLKYGGQTEQILVQNLPKTGALSLSVNIALIIAILFTYPLQVYPVIEIIEAGLFAKGGLFGPKEKSPLETTVDSVIATENEPLLKSQNDAERHIGKVIPDSVATWKRNIFRVCIAILIGGIAVLFKNVFAYMNAIVGAIGSCPLAFILPCLFHLKICGLSLHRGVIIKDIIIIIVGAIIGIISLVTTIQQIIEKIG